MVFLLSTEEAVSQAASQLTESQQPAQHPGRGRYATHSGLLKLQERAVLLLRNAAVTAHNSGKFEASLSANNTEAAHLKDKWKPLFCHQIWALVCRLASHSVD